MKCRSCLLQLKFGKETWNRNRVACRFLGKMRFLFLRVMDAPGPSLTKSFERDPQFLLNFTTLFLTKGLRAHTADIGARKTSWYEQNTSVNSSEKAILGRCTTSNLLQRNSIEYSLSAGWYLHGWTNYFNLQQHSRRRFCVSFEHGPQKHIVTISHRVKKAWS